MILSILPFTTAYQYNDNNLNIITLNIAGIISNTKRNVFEKWLIDNNIDIVILCEHYLRIEFSDSLFNYYNYRATSSLHWNRGWKYKNGIAIIWRKSIDLINFNIGTNALLGRYIKCDIIVNEINSNTISICGIYAPAQQYEKDNFYLELTNELKTIKNPYIIGGDFNSIMNVVDNYPPSSRSDFHINSLRLNLNLMDSISINTDYSIFNYHTYSFDYNTHISRIDYFLISNNINWIKHSVFHDIPFRDSFHVHYPVLVTINLVNKYINNIKFKPFQTIYINQNNSKSKENIQLYKIKAQSWYNNNINNDTITINNNNLNEILNKTDELIKDDFQHIFKYKRKTNKFVHNKTAGKLLHKITKLVRLIRGINLIYKFNTQNINQYTYWNNYITYFYDDEFQVNITLLQNNYNEELNKI